ncbi:MAG: GNAT family N-acetyltransferase [Promethearchaeota archaeon]
MDLINNIETKRLRLRPINHNDFEFFLISIKDDQVSENIKKIINLKNLENPEILFEEIIQLDAIFTLIISKKDTDEYIGICGLNILADSNEAICFYALLPKYRGFGFAIEAMKILIAYGFLKFSLNKITTYVEPTSSAIWKVAERVGMKYLGHIQTSKPQSKVMYFSIERNEFEAQQVT